MPENFIKPKLAERLGSWTTIGNDYVVVPDTDTGEEYHFVKGYKGKIVELICTTADLKFIIDASLDAVTWHPIKAETVLAIGHTYETNTEVWNYFRVQVKPNVGGVHGKLDVKIELSSL